MGTTVTPNLGLIKPDSAEPAQNWPSQVGSNMDALDLLASAWSSWVPSFTNFTLGNGAVDFAKFKRLFDSVMWQLTVTAGSTTSSSGLVQISLPVPPLGLGDGSVVGSGYVNDSSNSLNRRIVSCVKTSTSRFFMFNDGGNISDPFGGWDNNDRISCFGIYEAAP